MGNTNIKYIGFDTIQNINSTSLIITVMDNSINCFIPNTILPKEEEVIINNIIDNKKQNNYTIILYGKNCKDMDAIKKKILQFKEFGFLNIYVYAGGLFEWLLLREVFGEMQFPITGHLSKLGVVEYS